MNKQLHRLWERVEAVIIAIEDKEEVTYAGLQIQRSTFKHPLFCNTSYYLVTDLLSGKIILELHGHKEKLEICKYQKENYFWSSFISAAAKLRCLENTFGLCRRPE
ncbi:MAG: hypothetical protein KUG76_03825 [Gammaproteobacteria bacterium]|nr:hypothetical protein [Gammaproteobacteria bacterium]